MLRLNKLKQIPAVLKCSVYSLIWGFLININFFYHAVSENRIFQEGKYAEFKTLKKKYFHVVIKCYQKLEIMKPEGESWFNTHERKLHL